MTPEKRNKTIAAASSIGAVGIVAALTAIGNGEPPDCSLRGQCRIFIENANAESVFTKKKNECIAARAKCSPKDAACVEANEACVKESDDQIALISEGVEEILSKCEPKRLGGSKDPTTHQYAHPEETARCKPWAGFDDNGFPKFLEGVSTPVDGGATPPVATPAPSLPTVDHSKDQICFKAGRTVPCSAAGAKLRDGGSPK
jgi:hypothetical protein